jgi:hemolysin III
MHVSRELTAGERRADAIVHTVGVVASIVGASVLLAIAVASLPVPSIVSVAIYCAALVSVFAISAGYHLTTFPPVKNLLRGFDHAAIYGKIAATYTPFAVVKMGGIAGYTLLGLVWALALIGATAKLIRPNGFEFVSYILYLAQGWLCLAVLGPLIHAVSSRTIILLLLGGILYTTGVVFHLWRKLPYHTAIWHIFVIAASAMHFTAIADALDVV